MERRYYIGSDDDCHYFVIPVDQAEAWDAYVEASSKYWDTEWTNPKAEEPELPEGVIDIGGSPAMVSFTDPRIE